MAPSAMMRVQPVSAVRPHASLGKRFIAFVIDGLASSLIAGAFLTPAVLVLIENDNDLAALSTSAVILVIVGEILLLALAIFQWWYQGTRGFTIGKLLVKVRTVDAVSGTPVGMLRILLRSLILGVGSILVAFSTLFDKEGRNRGWHDSAAGTIVIDYAATANARGSADRSQYRGTGHPPQTPGGHASYALDPAQRYATPPPGLPRTTAQRPPGIPEADVRHNAPPPPQQSPRPPVSGPSKVPALPAYLVNQNNVLAPAAGGHRAVPPPPPLAPPAPIHAAAAEQSPAPAPAVAPEPDSITQDAVIMAVPGYSAKPDGAPVEEREEKVQSSPIGSGVKIDSRDASGIPPSATLTFSDGKRVTLTETVLIGRNPKPGGNEVIGELIRVPDPGRSVSKTHVLVGVDDEGVWVVDRASTNGTIVTLADGQQIICSPRQVVRLPGGAAVSFGDYSIHFEYRNN